MIYNTYIFNPVRVEFIGRALETLYKYTDMKKSRVIVVDQTLDGIKPSQNIHLHIRPHRNLGFSKSMNEGIIHAQHWGSKYITCANDDIEFMDKRWWPGIIETFKNGETIMAVNPMSPREPGWGYGWDHGRYIDLMDYKKKFTKKDYDWLLEGDFNAVKNLPDTFPRIKRGVIDAIATWCTVFKREFFDMFGLFDELYYPGGGEDYDLNARCYRKGYRMVGTTRSWVWHWWGSSKDKQHELSKGLPIMEEYRWMNPDYLWNPKWNNGQVMDPWGKWTDDEGEKHPMKRKKKVHVKDI